MKVVDGGGGQEVEDEGWLEDTAAYWVERAATIGRSQEAYYASIVATRLPPLADYTSDRAPDGGGSMRMRVLQPADDGRGGPVGGLGEVRGLASAAECEALIAVAKAAGLRPATVDSGGVDRSLRRSSTVSLPNWKADPTASAVVKRMAALLRLPLAATVAGAELHVGHYVPGEAYPAHHDASSVTSQAICQNRHRSHKQPVVACDSSAHFD